MPARSAELPLASLGLLRAHATRYMSIDNIDAAFELIIQRMGRQVTREAMAFDISVRAMAAAHGLLILPRSQDVRQP